MNLKLNIYFFLQNKNFYFYQASVNKWIIHLLYSKQRKKGNFRCFIFSGLKKRASIGRRVSFFQKD